MAGKKGKSGGDRKSPKAKGIDPPKLPPLPTNREDIEKDPRAAGWRRFWDARDLKVALDARRFLYKQWLGDPVHTVNHLHDKPLEVAGNLTFSIAAELREARERAGKK